MEEWKKIFEDKHELKADFAPNHFEQKLFKSGYDTGIQSQASTITHLESQQKHDLDKLAKAEKWMAEMLKFFESPMYACDQILLDGILENGETLLKGDTP